jgi:branched-chain amino acid aminotransferase
MGGTSMQEPLVYIDGEFAPKSKAMVSVFDHGLLYGDGVFEGIRAYSGSVFRLDEHVRRLYESAKAIRLSIPLSAEEMTEAILETLKKNQLRDAYIRVVVTRGAGDLSVDPASCKTPTVFVIAEPVVSALGPREPRVIKIVISSLRRDPVDGTTHETKSLNYLNSIMAKMDAASAGADDAILLDRRGFVSEGSATNVFLVKDGTISTPTSASGILHGITRARIIRLCTDLGMDISERDVTPYELITADEVFLAGTKAEIVAVGSINGIKIGAGGAGPITRRLLQEFGRLVRRPEEGTQVYERESVSRTAR